jgi:hypothetical protein
LTSTAFAILVLSSTFSIHALEPGGVLNVKVIDKEGNPVQAAMVKLDPAHRGVSYVSPTCKTDATGTCTRYKLPFGSYLVEAMKPSDGYPDLSFEFYSHETKRIQVALSRVKPQASVVFRLGAPMAKLKLSIIDDGTGALVDNPTITLRAGNNPHDWVSIGKTPDSIVLVPPDKDVKLEITADGYQPWQLKEHPELSPGGVVQLHSQEKQEMTVRLKHQRLD